MAITRKQLIKKYIEFFKSKNHKEIPNSSLIPENDPTVLFTTAGMHPLVPFILGQPHPQGKRLTNVQRCIRTGDIEEVGDSSHHTFFEMLGNWSLEDYWKKEAIEMTYEFVTKVLKVPHVKLAASCLKGYDKIPTDTESEKAYLDLNFEKERIVFLNKEENFWGPAGKTGPCGPNTEIFIWKQKNKKPPKQFDPEDTNWLEIGNNVLLEYNKNEKSKFEKLKQRTIDFGAGLERTLTILNNFEDSYLTEIWQPIIKQIEKLSNRSYDKTENQKPMRIIADHIKAAVMIIADGIPPSNLEQGYVIRRLIRRAIRYGRQLNIKKFTKQVAEPVFKIYKDYNHLQKNKQKILNELEKEENRFLETLEKGMTLTEKIFKQKEPINKAKFNQLIEDPNKAMLIGRIFDMKRNKKDYSLKKPRISKQEIDNATIPGKESFLLFQSYGFPLEMTDELAMARGFLVDHHGFRQEQQKHQKLSKTATEGKFKSGLQDQSEQTTKLHTATHLLLAALKKVLGKKVQQKGSNITPERLRFDFNFDRKLTDKEKQKVEEEVNNIISKDVPVEKQELTLEEAKKQDAEGVFNAKYGDKVTVYKVHNFSKEICAGPHVENTGDLGKFKIKKEESSSAGVRRIKGELLQSKEN